jgi:hydrogenase large subunit
MATKRIVIDPVTRIEGHLRVEAVVDGNKITDAISSEQFSVG